MVIIGENAQQYPASVNDAAYYKAAAGFPDDMIVVADPSFQKAGSAVQHPSTLGLPFMAMLGGDMEILGIDIGPGDFLTAVQEITGASVTPTCEGYCGGQALAGCYCDPACENYGDCCPDFAQWCQ